MVRPVSVSFPVWGQRTKIRLIAFPTFGKERVSNIVLTKPVNDARFVHIVW